MTESTRSVLLILGAFAVVVVAAIFVFKVSIKIDIPPPVAESAQ